jgi:LSD1 subclass zinc finger protein
MEIKGEIMSCPHCRSYGTSTGKCDCAGCRKSLGLDPSGSRSVPCSACGGKGQVWVGPQMPTEIHEHTHTHEAGGIDQRLLEQLSRDFTELLDKFSELIGQQSETLSRLTDIADRV